MNEELRQKQLEELAQAEIEELSKPFPNKERLYSYSLRALALSGIFDEVFKNERKY